ncbi:MAG: sulfatase-like hydrolase/transferase [Myxococcales bacterium]|nr:sulfatase-like hydrolase/transferase [Myxococcales bacterium]
MPLGPFSSSRWLPAARWRRLLLLGLTPLLFYVACKQAQTSGTGWPPVGEALRDTRPDVVIVTIDSVRADHVGAYGYARRTTPNLDQLAARGVRFERAYSQAPHTSFSIASLLTGRYFGLLSRMVPEALLPTLASHFAAYGWQTAAIYPPAIYVTDEAALAPYKSSHFGFQHVRCEYLSADQSVDEAIRFFEQKRPERAFLWLHLFEPHEPYEAGGAPQFGSTAMDRYDQELVVADAALGRLAHYLEKKQPGFILVVTSDHGEAFNEHGESLHGTNLHEEQVRVPLVLLAPHLRPQVISEPVQLVDVFPTLAQLANARWLFETDGRDLLPALTGQFQPGAAAFAALEDQRMIATQTHKLIWDLRRGTSQLFDLQRDPGEREDLSQRDPRTASLLRSELYTWIEARMESAQRLRWIRALPRAPTEILRARLGDVRAVDGLLRLLTRSDEPSVQEDAGRLLLRLPPQSQTGTALTALTRNPDARVADIAHIAALRLGHAPSQIYVLRLAQDAAADTELRLRAVEVLAFRRVQAALPALLDLLDHATDYEAQRAVIGFLGQLRDPRALPALLQRVQDPMVQREVLRALGEIGSPECIPALLHRLATDPRVLARLEAARALRRIGGSEAQAALVQAAASDPEQAVRDAAQPALHPIERPAAPKIATQTAP